MKKKYNGVEDRQSYISTSGKNWEIAVMDFVNNYFMKGNRISLRKFYLGWSPGLQIL